MYRLIRPIYHRLPIAPHHKDSIKNYLYANFAPFFSRSFGYRNWLRARQEPDALPKVPRPEAPSDEAWDALLRDRASLPTAVGDQFFVVVPVYRGHDETLACLYSVLRAEPRTSLVVVDDASPDPALAGRVEELASAGLLELHRHPSNLGFVAAANTGMGLYRKRDVVLLNSDAQVFGDGLARLQRTAYARSDIGTVTPLSNNAEICSYPRPLVDNDVLLELDDASLDSLAAEANLGCYVEAPTAVGFCMYIRRDCLAETGLFDPAFGKGYGEENDFCLRAAARGWKHVVAGDVFVRHIGGVSFGDKNRRCRGEALVSRRFPHYRRQIAEYIERDEVRPLRLALDVARLAQAAPHRRPKKTLLFVTHNWGGGVERHVQDMRLRLEAEQVNVYLLRPHGEGPAGCAGISHPKVELSPNLRGFPIGDGQGPLLDALQRLGVDHIHVQHLAGFGDGAPDCIRSLSQGLGCPYDVTLHDYMPVCPRVHLIGNEESYCGEPDLASCERCVRKLGTPFGRPSVAPWRERWRRMLAEARRVFSPSRDVLLRMQLRFPEASLCLRPHPELSEPSRPHGTSGRRGSDRKRLRVAVIGAIGPHKGAAVLLACASDAATRRLPLEFCLFGFSDRDDALARTGRVILCGEYDEAGLPKLLTEMDCDLCFLPSLWPETHCYTLSAALLGRLYPVAFDLGAPAERIAEENWGRVLPFELWRNPSAVNDTLLAIDAPTPPLVVERGHRYATLTRDYYDDFAPVALPAASRAAAAQKDGS